jgi:lysophospholipase L1-like esterase
LLLVLTASVLAAVGRTQLAAIGLAIAVVGQQLAWAYPAAARRAAGAVDRSIERLGVGLGAVLFGAVHLVLIVPAWALGGRRALRGEHRWHPSPPAAEQPRRLHGPPTRTPPASSRGRDALVGAALVIVAVALVRLGPPTTVRSGPIEDRATATAQLAPALADQPSAPTVLAEQGAAFAGRLPDAELGWTMGDSAGTLVNSRDGERVTPPATEASDALEVWFFGGSVVWGLGQSDAATIPARFASRATRAGVPVIARNFAAPAYMIEQSSLLFERQLADEAARPDLVIFLDGYNEMYGGMASTLAGVAPGTPFFAYAATGAAGTGSAYRGPTATLEDRYEGVLEVHALGRERATRAAAEADVPIVFAWQPNAHSGALRPGELDVLHELGWSDEELADLHTADQELRRRLPDEVIDLGDVFEAVDRPIYWDTVHVDESGADVIAAALLDELSDRLDAMEGDR